MCFKSYYCYKNGLQLDKDTAQKFTQTLSKAFKSLTFLIYSRWFLLHTFIFCQPQLLIFIFCLSSSWNTLSLSCLLSLRRHCFSSKATLQLPIKVRQFPTFLSDVSDCFAPLTCASLCFQKNSVSYKFLWLNWPWPHISFCVCISCTTGFVNLTLTVPCCCHVYFLIFTFSVFFCFYTHILYPHTFVPRDIKAALRNF